MTKHISVIFHVLLTIIGSASAFQFYADRIPNGNNVKHPCNPNINWYGVGHHNPQGGGARNVFGEAFANSGHEWTESLCKGDADIDGLTNGYELGDPDCVWKIGDAPARTKNITHPGFCDPIDSAACQARENFTCGDTGYECPYFKNETDVRNMTIRLDETQCPAEETTYICQHFEFPEDETFDVIGWEPIIDNRNLLHHMIMWGCSDPAAKDIYSSPASCTMRPRKCQMLLDGWTLGNYGKCLPPHVAIRLGKDGWRHIVLQVHWNNPEKISTYTDSSGMLLHYTPNLRDNAQVTFIMGNLGFSIPPGKESHTEMVVMEEECSRGMQTSSFYVHSINLHMHNIGKRATIEHYRNGSLIEVLAKDDPYSYDFPVFHGFDEPREIKVGDKLSFTCEFDSRTRDTATNFGEATSDEMCFAFMSMTPQQPGFPDVDRMGIVDMCTAQLPQYGGSEGHLGFIGGSSCHFTSFTMRERPNMISGVRQYCQTEAGCTAQCMQHAMAYKNHPCTQANPAGLVEFIAMRQPSMSEEDKTVLANAISICEQSMTTTPPACQASASHVNRPGLHSVAIVVLMIYALR